MRTQGPHEGFNLPRGCRGAQATLGEPRGGLAIEGRLETGIPGLDEMTGGGWVVPSSVLVAGAPGTGKTTLAVQTLFHGARKGETCVYFTGISEPGWVVQQFLKGFAFFDQSLIDQGKVVFADIGAALRKGAREGIEHIEREVERIGPSRIVIDPITAVHTAVDSERQYRELLHDLTAHMKGLNTVLIMTSETDPHEQRWGTDGYMVDSIVLLTCPKEGTVRRKYLEVVKMRGTKHMGGDHVADLGSAGFSVQPGLR